jgi:hypothetical protein
MHDYTARIVHDERMRQFRKEAHAAGLAALSRRTARTQLADVAIGQWINRLIARWSRARRPDAQADGLSRGFRPAAHAKLGEDV